MFNEISHFDCIDIKDFTCTNEDFAFYKFIKKYLTLRDKIISVKRKPIKTDDIFLTDEIKPLCDEIKLLLPNIEL